MAKQQNTTLCMDFLIYFTVLRYLYIKSQYGDKLRSHTFFQGLLPLQVLICPGSCLLGENLDRWLLPWEDDKGTEINPLEHKVLLLPKALYVSMKMRMLS